MMNSRKSANRPGTGCTITQITLKYYKKLNLFARNWKIVYKSCGDLASPLYTGRFIIFSVITNIYNKKTEGPTLTFRNRASSI